MYTVNKLLQVSYMNDTRMLLRGYKCYIHTKNEVQFKTEFYNITASLITHESFSESKDGHFTFVTDVT
jgi:hypothetical protein